MNYTFICKDEHNRTEITYEIDEPNATELLQAFLYFMAGCSFHSETIKNSVEEVSNE